VSGVCGPETKHNGRRAPKPKLFVSARRLDKRNPEPRKIVLDSSAGEDDVEGYSLEAKHDEKQRQDQSYIFW
jgi:hypothetical protein